MVLWFYVQMCAWKYKYALVSARLMLSLPHLRLVQLHQKGFLLCWTDSFLLRAFCIVLAVGPLLELKAPPLALLSVPAVAMVLLRFLCRAACMGLHLVDQKAVNETGIACCLLRHFPLHMINCCWLSRMERVILLHVSASYWNKAVHLQGTPAKTEHLVPFC